MKNFLLLTVMFSSIYGISTNSETISVEACENKVKSLYKDTYIDLIDVSLEGNIYTTKWESGKDIILCKIKNDKLINISRDRN